MPATFEYFPFDNQPSYEAQWRDMMETMRSTGIILWGNSLAKGNLAVIPGTGLQIRISPGKAWMKGHMFKHTGEPYELGISSNNSGSTRNDLIVLRADFVSNTIEYKVVENSTTPTQNATVWELPLAQVIVSNGATTIISSDIKDLRVVSSQAGFTPFCIAKHSTSQAVAQSGATGGVILEFDTIDFDPTHMHQTGSQAERQRFYIKEAGLYLVNCSIGWEDPGYSPASSDYGRRLQIFKVSGSNTTFVSGDHVSHAGKNYAVFQNAGRIIEAFPDDYFYAKATNFGDATLRVQISPVFSIIKVGTLSGI
jgi:hypothetical protein